MKMNLIYSFFLVVKRIWSFFSWTACNTLSGPCASTSTKRVVVRVKMGIHCMMWACLWAKFGATRLILEDRSAAPGQMPDVSHEFLTCQTFWGQIDRAVTTANRPVWGFSSLFYQGQYQQEKGWQEYQETHSMTQYYRYILLRETWQKKTKNTHILFSFWHIQCEHSGRDLKIRPHMNCKLWLPSQTIIIWMSWN